MAKGIRERLLEQVGKFHQWQEITYPGKTTEEIGGAWEVDYPAWNDIFDAFCHVLTQMDAEMADSVLLDEMVYLIARANEAEGFIQETTSPIPNGSSASAAGPQPPMRMRPSGSLPPICRNAHVVRKSGI